jgi:GNAT superfamily N-acetyltransferase
MIVRLAKYKDIVECMDIGEEFWLTTPYAQVVPYNAGGVAGLLTSLVQAENMLVAIDEDKIIGVSALLVTPFHFNPDIKMGCELFWYVNPDAREKGVGAVMLGALEEMAKQKGATLWSMGSFGWTDADTMLKKRGYALTEKTYSKVL